MTRKQKRAAMIGAALITLSTSVANAGDISSGPVNNTPPSLQGVPLSERDAELTARMEAHLKAAPDDGKAWELMSTHYWFQKRYDQAADAFKNSIRLNGETYDRLYGFAFVEICRNKGTVDREARIAAEKALLLKPMSSDAKIWLALFKDQTGDVSGAIDAYESLVASAPPPLSLENLQAAAKSSAPIATDFLANEIPLDGFRQRIAQLKRDPKAATDHDSHNRLIGCDFFEPP